MRARGILVAAVLTVAACGAKTGLDVAGGGGATSDCDAAAPVPIEPGTCSDDAHPLSATPAELEITIVMDTSGSMKQPSLDGVVKLDAVRSALSAFLNDPASAGLSANITFFPIVRPEVSPSCASDAECGPGGSCQLFSSCSNDGAYCLTHADCESYAFCMASGWCQNSTVCEPAAYEPSFEPVTLPGGAPTIIAQFAAKTAEGATPTLPALAGAHQASAKQIRRAPGKKRIVLLATDGLPTACDPAIPAPNVQSSAGIPKLVEVAEEGLEHGVQTFVVGVFAADEQDIAKANLDTIAKAGGSETAFIITTDQTVSTRFLDTLNEIRAQAGACSYALPRPGGVALDATRIAVRLAGPNMTWWLEQRASLADCDPLHGGFAFDLDPLGAEAPTRIELCPSSCALLESDPTLGVEVVADCRP